MQTADDIERSYVMGTGRENKVASLTSVVEKKEKMVYEENQFGWEGYYKKEQRKRQKTDEEERRRRKGTIWMKLNRKGGTSRTKGAKWKETREADNLF